jgi:PAS domain S-box-containing protein
VDDEQKLYRALFEGTATAVTVRSAEDLSFIDCNAAALRLYRAASVEELRGSKVTDLSAEMQPDGTRSTVALRTHVARAIQDGVARLEWSARRLDGSEFLASMRIEALELGGGRRVLQTIVEDITEKKAAEAALARAQEALRASEERYRMVAERSRDVIIIADLEGGIVFASPAVEALAGYTPDECRGKIIDDLVDPEEWPRLPSVYAGMRAGVPGGAEWFARRKDGTRVRVDSVRAPVHDAAGRVTGAQMIVRDVSERHRMEQARDAAQAALAQAKEEALAASRAKSAFVANMSHELRTPLHGVIGMVDLLSRTPLDPRQARYVEVASASARLLLSVINDILDLSKIEAGKLDIQRGAFSPRELVEEVTKVLEHAAQQKGLVLSSRVEPGLSGPLVGDATRIEQVLVNLVGNAVKFTDAGSVTVTAAPKSGPEGAKRLRFTVRDTGIGISAAERPRLFEPFTQLDSSPTRQHGGSGLGLAICRELVQRMGGEIGVDSTPGVGSSFWFTVPLELASTRPEGRIEPGVGRVLLVEDTPVGAEIVGAILRGSGYTCDVAADGSQAVEAVRRSRYDIVLMDCQLPGMDGYEAAARIRALRGPHVPILALTASATADDAARARLAGMDGHVPKPVDAKRLLVTIAEHLRKPAVRVVDLQRALERLEGNKALLARLIGQFRTEAASGRRNLEESWSRRDAASVAYAAHRLRGQAESLGGSLLASALARLEQIVAEGEWIAGAPAMDAVRSALEQMLDALVQ